MRPMRCAPGRRNAPWGASGTTVAFREDKTAREVPTMFGLGILGTILLIVLILWLLGVIG